MNVLRISSSTNYRSGTFVFHSSMTPTEAIAMLNNSSDKVEEIRCAVMALRTEILAVPASKTPSPTSIHTLKEIAPNIPHLVLLFFRTLIGGLQVEPELRHSRDVIEKKHWPVHRMLCSIVPEAQFVIGRFKALCLGQGTLTGSKSLLSILNRFGHCISYDEVKKLETEIAGNTC